MGLAGKRNTGIRCRTPHALALATSVDRRLGDEISLPKALGSIAAPERTLEAGAAAAPSWAAARFFYGEMYRLQCNPGPTGTAGGHRLVVCTSVEP